MEKVVPVLQIDDYEEAKSFYVERLGFSINFEHRHEPGFPVFMGVERGELFIHLSEHGKGHPGSEVYIFVEDVQEWAQRMESHGVDIGNGPIKQPWGNTDLPIVDPFRNMLRFSQLNTHEGQSTPNK